MKVWNMVSEKTDRAIPNQFIIKHGRSLYFQSYETVVARIDNVDNFDTGEEVFLVDGATDFSKTTSKFLYQFLREHSLIDGASCNKKGIEALIKNGKITTCEIIF